MYREPRLGTYEIVRTQTSTKKRRTELDNCPFNSHIYYVGILELSSGYYVQSGF